MKKYIVQYRPFLLFLGKFFLAYLVLTLFYQLYLRQFESPKLDSITNLVAKNTEYVLQIINSNARVDLDKPSISIPIFYNQKNVARIIEGCNAISVIILFISFVIAFSGKIKQTIFFILGGSIFIYALNISRIILLSVLMFHYPQFEHILHGVIFPLIIYGAVFILWIVWVNKFSKYATKTV